MKKLILLITTIVSVFIIFLVCYFKSHSYEMTYNINGVDVIESYNKDDSYYVFKFVYDKKEYELYSNNKYSNKRKLVKDITISKKDNEVCLDFDTKHVTLYPICSNEDGYYSKFIKKEAKFTKNNTYENILIDNLDGNNYLLWNYHSFIYLSKKKNTKIDLFKKDIYNLNLIYQMDNKLLVPNYDENYKFNKLYIINSDNAKVSNMKLRYEVYFDSYFLGHDDNQAYLYDIKSEQEFYFDFKEDEIYKTKYKIIVNDSWESVTNQTLKNYKPTFKKDSLYEYTLKDDTLYFKASVGNISYKVSNRKISNIVKQDGMDVYYISGDTLYYFNISSGEKALLKYSEWEFNNSNMVFVF